MELQSFELNEFFAHVVENRSAVFISPEDIVLAKLIAFQETGSDKHLRDARGVLVTQWETIKLAAIRRAAQSADVLTYFEQIVELARKEIGR